MGNGMTKILTEYLSSMLFNSDAFSLLACFYFYVYDRLQRCKYCLSFPMDVISSGSVQHQQSYVVVVVKPGTGFERINACACHVERE
jgi:hypothetical protein